MYFLDGHCQKSKKKANFSQQKNEIMQKQLIEKFFDISLIDAPDFITAEVNSKKIKPGMIFFALEGQKTDGHLFLQEAFDNGALFAVVAENKPDLNFKGRLIKVKNPLEALQGLAKFHFLYLNVPTIGVTGSCGKSTTKEYICQMLKNRYRVGKTVGNQNSQIGLALSLISFQGDEDVLVLEMGMSEKGNIEKLCKIASPTHAVLTNIDVNHIEQFGSKEKIAEEKACIFHPSSVEVGFIEKGAALYPAIRALKLKETVFFSIDDCLEGDFLNIGTTSIDLKKIPEGQEQFSKNLLVAALVAKRFSITDAQILKTVEELQTLEHRFQMITKKRCLIIDDAYNSSLKSLELACLQIEKKVVVGRKIAVIGALGEQGDLEELHHEKMALILQNRFDQVYLIGKPAIHTARCLKQLGQNAHFCDSLVEIAAILQDEIQFNDLLFLKGANQYRLWELVDLLPVK